MDQVERFALWAIVVFTLLFTIFRPAASGWVGSASSIFDVSDLNSFPRPVAQTIQNSGKQIFAAVGKKLTEEWAQTTAADQQSFLNAAQKITASIIQGIQANGVSKHPAVKDTIAKTGK